MKKTKKILGLFIAVLVMAVTFLNYIPTYAVENASDSPRIAWVGLEHSPLIAGETETFVISTQNADKVQYQITMRSQKTGIEENLTNGWGTAVEGNVQYSITPPKKFDLGKYDLIISAKRVSDGKIGTYTAEINCVSKDDNNRIYTTGAVNIPKTEYTLGEKVTINGVGGLSGIMGPYLYKMHIYNITTGTWINDVQKDYRSNIEWTPGAAGTYALLIYVNSQNSTTWDKYQKYLNLSNPTAVDRRGTYEGWKYIVINVSDTFKVSSVNATNQETLNVTFNKEIGTVTPANFSITKKDDPLTSINIEKVTISKNVATIATYDTLDENITYTLKSSNISSLDGKLKITSSINDFKYTKTEAASIAFKATKYALGKEIELIIKDKNGNDITPNFDLTKDVEVEISNEYVVKYSDGELTAAGLGNAIVNVKLLNTSLETGNTVITVATSTDSIASIGAADISEDGDFDFNNPSLIMYADDSGREIGFVVLDQNGEEIDDVVKTYQSLSSSVLVVDRYNGTIIPLASGTAQVVLKAELNGKSISKTVTITVKGEKIATSLKPDKTSVKVVGGSDIGQNVKIKLYDQYGTAMDMTNGDDITVSVKDNDPSLISCDYDIVDGAIVVTATPGDYTDKTTTKTVTVTYRNGTNTLRASFTAALVKPGEFIGYAVVADYTTLDLYTADEDYSKGPISTILNIYKRDSNGNYIGKVLPSDNDISVFLETSNSKVSTSSNAAFEVIAEEKGTSTVTVKIGSSADMAVTVGKITFTIVNSEPSAAVFTQVKTVIEAGHNVDLFSKLFGTNGAFTAKNQYGQTVTIKPENVDVYSTDSSLVSVSSDGDITTSSVNDGMVKLIVSADKIYEINVVVK